MRSFEPVGAVRGMLIAGAESLLLTAIVQEAERRAVPYTPALISQDGRAEKFRRERAGEGGAGRALEWNAQSALSARTLLSAALNRHERLDCAMLVCTPPQRFRSAELDVAEIGDVIDKHIKSYLFLSRVLRAHFKREGEGILAFVAGGGGGFHGELDGTVMAAFGAFTDGLFASSAEGGERLIGFSAYDALSSADAASGAAARIFKILEEDRKTAFGKWHKCGRSAGLFRP